MFPHQTAYTPPKPKLPTEAGGLAPGGAWDHDGHPPVLGALTIAGAKKGLALGLGVPESTIEIVVQAQPGRS